MTLVKGLLLGGFLGLMSCGTSAQRAVIKQVKNTVVKELTSQAKQIGQTPQLNPDYAQGVSGHFVSIQPAPRDTSSLIMIMGGGCNFPDKPVAEGGKKRYYDEVYISEPFNNTTAPKWRLAGRLSVPLAYAQVETLPDGGLVIYGGETPDGDTDLIHHIASTGEVTLSDQRLHTTRAGGICVKGKIFGGRAGGKLSGYILDIATNSSEVFFTDTPPLKIIGGLSLTNLRYGDRSNGLWFWGNTFGFGSEQLVEAGVRSYNNFSLDYPSWSEREVPMHPSGANFGGGSAVPLPNGHYLLVGGVNENIFLPAVQRGQRLAWAKSAGNTEEVAKLESENREYLNVPESYYKFNPRAYLLDAWRIAPMGGLWQVWAQHSELARADAVWLMWGNTLLVVGGEVKPGVRTSAITRVYPLEKSLTWAEAPEDTEPDIILKN